MISRHMNGKENPEEILLTCSASHDLFPVCDTIEYVEIAIPQSVMREIESF